MRAPTIAAVAGYALGGASAESHLVHKRTRVAPGVELVGRPVAGEDPFHDDATLGEPRRGSAWHADRRNSFLVGTDFGVGHARVIVNSIVQICICHSRTVAVRAIAALAGAFDGLSGVALALVAAQEPVAAAVGDVGELGDVETWMSERGGPCS